VLEDQPFSSVLNAIRAKCSGVNVATPAFA
jgi:hypothetical protein